MQQLPAVQLAEDLQDAGDLAAGGPLRPSSAGPREECAQIAVARVLERQDVEDGLRRPQQRKRVEDANRARVILEQLAEVRLAQPAADVRAHLETDHLRHPGRAPETMCEVHLAEPALAEPADDAILTACFGTRDDVAGREVPRAAAPIGRSRRDSGRGVVSQHRRGCAGTDSSEF